MTHPLLTGRAATSTEPSTGRAVFVVVLALAALLGVAAWRFIPHAAPPAPVVAPPAPIVTPPVTPTPPPPTPAPTEDQQLHLEHAEQALVAAAEQINAARRQLAALSPDLARSYLSFEKRRADNAWTSCDAAARAIEQARDDIKVVASKGKD